MALHIIIYYIKFDCFLSHLPVGISGCIASCGWINQVHCWGKKRNINGLKSGVIWGAWNDALGDYLGQNVECGGSKWILDSDDNSTNGRPLGERPAKCTHINRNKIGLRVGQSKQDVARRGLENTIKSKIVRDNKNMKIKHRFNKKSGENNIFQTVAGQVIGLSSANWME